MKQKEKNYTKRLVNLCARQGYLQVLMKTEVLAEIVED